MSNRPKIKPRHEFTSSETGNYFDPGTGEHVVVDGSIVERDALHIAERIKEYDPNLELLCLNDPMSNFRDAPFVVCERRPDGTLHRVFEAWELDERILERIFNADSERFDPLAHVETLEKKRKRELDARYKETIAENNDILLHAILSRTSSYTVKNTKDELVRIHEDKPPTRVASETTIMHGPART